MPQFHIIRHVDALLALKAEWDELWQRTPQASYFQSAAYAIHSWQQVAEPNGCTLFCVTARSEGRLTLVWPLKIHRRALWRIVRPLASNAAEGTDVLADVSAIERADIAEALNIVRRQSGADIIDLPFVATDTDLGMQAGESFAAGEPYRNPFQRWMPDESFEDYKSGLSKQTRKVVDKKHRRLTGMGDLRFALLRGEEQIVEAVRTLLRYKRIWAGKLAERGAYVHSPHFERFLTAISLDAGDEQGMLLFVLTLNGVILAVQSAAVGHHVDWLAAAYHPDHHQVSPGIVLNEYCLRWAHERGLAVRMGPGQQANKEFWCRHQAYGSTSYRVAASVRGALGLRIVRARGILTALRRHGAGASRADRESAAEASVRPASG